MIPRMRAWIKSSSIMLDLMGFVDYKDTWKLYYGSGIHEYWNKENVEIIMSTGLRDKNGNEIWEGDIVAAYGWYYRVAWTGQKFVFSLKRDDLYGPDFGYFSSEEMEVVGNIHQNPELLTA